MHSYKNNPLPTLKINIEQTAVILNLQERVVILAGKVALKLRLH